MLLLGFPVRKGQVGSLCKISLAEALVVLHTVNNYYLSDIHIEILYKI